MSSPRSSEVYVSGRVRSGLYYASLKLSEANERVTADQLADEALAAWLVANHPAIMEFVDKREADDAAFKKSLIKPLPI